MYIGADTHEYQKRAFDPLELEALMVVNHLIWVLKTKPQSSAKQQSPLPTPTSQLTNTTDSFPGLGGCRCHGYSMLSYPDQMHLGRGQKAGIRMRPEKTDTQRAESGGVFLLLAHGTL